MKKIILFLIVTVFMACKGSEGPAGLDGVPGKDGEGVKWSTMSYTIKSSDWKLKGEPNELNSHYYADVTASDLSPLVYDEGTVIGYIQTDSKVKNGLPYVLHLGEEKEGKEFLWTQTYDFDFEPGFIRFYATFSDFLTTQKPGNETFHIVLMW